MDAVLSADENVRAAAIAALRDAGPAGLEKLFVLRERFVKRRDAAADDPKLVDQLTDRLARLDEAIDRVGAQRYCSASRLYWYTDLEKAQAEAARTGRPILSLRMLGLLTDEYSCANSRFFRTTLYANEEVSRTLREQFVLHWQSVRPAPRITIDFGDGRKLERTITGNSAHYVLAADGRPLDALPGLYGPGAFRAWLDRAAHLAEAYDQTADGEKGKLLLAYHSQRRKHLDACWRADLAKIGAEPARSPDELTDEAAWRQIAALHAQQAALDAASIELIAAENPTAAQAGRLAVTKSVIEDPLVRLVGALQTNIALDTVRNEYLLHRRLHAQFLADPELSRNADALNEWIYAELFLTPSNDPWLGLAPPDAYTALRNNGGGDVELGRKKDRH